MQSDTQLVHRVWRFFWGLAISVTLLFWAYLFVMRTMFDTTDPWTWDLHKDPWVMKSCDRTERDVTASPGGEWQAMTVDFACGGFGGAGFWTAVAIVKFGQQPSARDAVLYGDNIYNQPTQLQWQGDGRLKITLPHDATISTQAILHRLIAIEVQFKDADARAKL